MDSILRHPIQVRRAKEGDEQTIHALLYDAFAGYRYLYTEKAFNATLLGIDKIRNRITSNTMWVALFNDIVRGTVSLVADDEGLCIKTVAVSPMFRRKGLGKALMMHAEAEAVKMGAEKLKLTTTAFLFEAVALYKELGFQPCGFQDLFGTQLIRMEKTLRPQLRDHSFNTISNGTHNRQQKENAN